MIFNPDNITKQHVLDAVEKIERENIELTPSTKFDVIINGKAYPPKEIMRYAHELLNGERIWERSGGEPTNKYLTALGFELKAKQENNISNILLKEDVCLFKISMSGNEIDNDAFIYFNQKNLVVVHKDTSAKGTSHQSQGDTFSKQMKIGDYFYLCRGNNNLEVIGRILSDPEPCEYDDFGDNGWLQRSYEIVTKAGKSGSYQGEKKWWTPNDNSTCILIPKNESDRANQNIFIPFFNLEFKYEKVISENNKRETNQTQIPTNMPLNQILFGPPGTGKTYNSIDKAVSIVTGSSSDHKSNKKVFDELRKEGQIEFVTFHQNYSYEDFMLGLKPDIEFDNLRFVSSKGIFYNIAKRARENYENSLKDEQTISYENWVKEKFEEFLNYIRETLESGNEYKIGNKFPDRKVLSIEEDIYYQQSGDKGVPRHMDFNDIIFAYLDNTFDNKTLQNNIRLTKTARNPGLSQYYVDILNQFKNFAGEYKEQKNSTSAFALKNYVLIIDEINRANISKVFGELITLLEDDKRLGADNELKITLPNGEKEFGVPPNLYLIGTMNTADKSIALIDIALRRRFEFIGFYPNDEVLDDEASDLLQTINQEIYKLKNSADYLIGHAYFMKQQPIEVVLKNKVIPLLMEYFSGKTQIISGIFNATSWKVEYDLASFEWKITKS